MNDLVKGTLLLAGGIVIGAAAALLLAPQTGEETRKQLADLAGDLKNKAEEAAKKAEEYALQAKEHYFSKAEKLAAAPAAEAVEAKA